MSEGTKKKDQFDSAGEAVGYTSLDQAVLQARTLARQGEERQRQRLGWDEIVWTEANSEQREDSYRVVLQFRRPGHGLREDQTGEEEFIFDLTGSLQDRQVLAWPEAARTGTRVGQPVASPPAGESPYASRGAANPIWWRIRPLRFPFKVVRWKITFLLDLLETPLPLVGRRFPWRRYSWKP